MNNELDEELFKQLRSNFMTSHTITFEVEHMSREELIETLINNYGGDYAVYHVYPKHELEKQVNELN